MQYSLFLACSFLAVTSLRIQQASDDIIIVDESSAPGSVDEQKGTWTRYFEEQMSESLIESGSDGRRRRRRRRRDGDDCDEVDTTDYRAFVTNIQFSPGPVNCALAIWEVLIYVYFSDTVSVIPDSTCGPGCGVPFVMVQVQVGGVTNPLSNSFEWFPAYFRSGSDSNILTFRKEFIQLSLMPKANDLLFLDQNALFFNSGAISHEEGIPNTNEFGQVTLGDQETLVLLSNIDISDTLAGECVTKPIECPAGGPGGAPAPSGPPGDGSDGGDAT